MLYEISDGDKIKYIRVNASAKDSRENAYLYMCKLAKVFSGPQYFIPKVYFFDHDYNAIAYKNADGDLLVDLIQRKQNLDQPIALAGQWLKELHTKTNPIIAHGDYQPTNIIINQNTISVFDFNDSGHGDTIIDVVSFLTQLKVMLLRFSSLSDYDRLKNIFIENYQLPYDQEIFIKLAKEKNQKIYETLNQSVGASERNILEEIKKLED